jgi:hypothetical protein
MDLVPGWGWERWGVQPAVGRCMPFTDVRYGGGGVTVVYHLVSHPTSSFAAGADAEDLKLTPSHLRVPVCVSVCLAGVAHSWVFVFAAADPVHQSEEDPTSREGCVGQSSHATLRLWFCDTAEQSNTKSLFATLRPCPTPTPPPICVQRLF